MAIIYEKNRVSFSAVIYEDEISSLREYLKKRAGSEIIFDFKECDDVHLAVLQLVLAYKKSYTASYEFNDSKKLYESVLRGFALSENYCN